MRLIVTVLLAVNVLLFAYLYGQPADEGAVGTVDLPGQAVSLNVPSLLLLNELMPEVVESSMLQLKAISTTAIPDAKPCLIAGPIDTRSRAASIAAYINSRGRSAEVAVLPTSSNNGFQLFIGPMFSTADAEDRRSELELMGLTANMVEDEAGLSLSLGLFATQQEASEKQAELEKLELEVGLRPLSLEQEQFWLVLGWQETPEAVLASVEGLTAFVPELTDISLKYCMGEG